MINIFFIGLSFLLSLLSMPIIIAVCKKFNLYDYHDKRKIHSGNIPRLGGVGIFCSFVISTFAFLAINKDISVMKNLPIMIACFIIFLFAVLDDIFTFPAFLKLVVQLAASAIVTFNGFRFNQIFAWHIPAALSHIITFCWIVGLINAYNLIDGLDGLCGSLSITAIITIGLLYAFSGNQEAFICFILAASILGFLCFNWPPAKIFMGDCGSQFLGFMIAILPFYTSGDYFEYNKFLIMIVLTAFPLFDTIAAIWRRLRDHKPIMSPDKAHLHHKLLNMGFSSRSALFLIFSLQIILCLSVTLAYFMGTFKGFSVLALAAIFMIWIFAVIHYTNRGINRLHRGYLQQQSEEPQSEENQNQ